MTLATSGGRRFAFVSACFAVVAVFLLCVASLPGLPDRGTPDRGDDPPPGASAAMQIFELMTSEVADHVEQQSKHDEPTEEDEVPSPTGTSLQGIERGHSRDQSTTGEPTEVTDSGYEFVEHVEHVKDFESEVEHPREHSTKAKTTDVVTTPTVATTKTVATTTTVETTTTVASTVTTTTVTTATTTTETRETTTYHPQGPKPWLFCWSHMQPKSEEELLIKEQLKRRASIFACNDFAVISSNKTVIGEIRGAQVQTWWNPEVQVPTGQYGMNGQKTDSFLNAKTFLHAWDMLINSGIVQLYDFTVKVDPDCVFFPNRLRAHIPADKIGENVYFANCGIWGSGPKLYGSLEVFSQAALYWYERRGKECKLLPWHGWGEDFYMQKCMDMLGVQQAPDFDQVGDERCLAAPCTDWTKVAYHPYKTVYDWVGCYESTFTTTTTKTTTSTSTTITTTSSTSTKTWTPAKDPSPTLFCWSHMATTNGQEVALIHLQFKRRANIFACNGFAVISSVKVSIGHINGSSVDTWVIQEQEVAMGQRGVNGATTDSFLNTKTFLDCWDTLMNSGEIWAYDFVVKVDPDAVFFPDRMRKHVKPHVGTSVYFVNCGKWGGAGLLYGSVEVFSTEALMEYGKKKPACQALPWHGWGEDYYMQHCMTLIGVPAVQDFQQVGDDRCIGAPCSDWTKSAFHDFKDPVDWMKCFQIAIGEFEED